MIHRIENNILHCFVFILFYLIIVIRFSTNSLSYFMKISSFNFRSHNFCAAHNYFYNYIFFWVTSYSYLIAKLIVFDYFGTAIDRPLIYIENFQNK